MKISNLPSAARRMLMALVAIVAGMGLAQA
jgi:hypothetical protein